jgi:hypothetical protein
MPGSSNRAGVLSTSTLFIHVRALDVESAHQIVMILKHHRSTFMLHQPAEAAVCFSNGAVGRQVQIRPPSRPQH